MIALLLINLIKLINKRNFNHKYDLYLNEQPKLIYIYIYFIDKIKKQFIFHLKFEILILSIWVTSIFVKLWILFRKKEIYIKEISDKRDNIKNNYRLDLFIEYAK